MYAFISFLCLLGSVSILYAQAPLFQLRNEFQRPTAQRDQPVQDQYPAAEKKSTATAVFYSLLLPGLGEWYIDRLDQGKYSIIAEAGLWFSYYSFVQYGSWIRDDARRFAVVHAQANIDGKNDQYFVNLGNFNDMFEYNEKKLIDRTPERLYEAEGGFYWQWDSDARRREYRAMRVSSEKVFNNSKFVIGAIVVNHIISAINVARLARQHNTRGDDGLGSWRMESSLGGNGVIPDGIRLSLIRQF
jgi:TM2 domain-containing membrane protein YozV